MIKTESIRATSPSPSSTSSNRRLSLSGRLAALGIRLTNSISRDTEATFTEETYEGKDSVPPTLPVIGLKERSQSRGREVLSTGRGGLGNIRQTSASTSRARPGTDHQAPGPDDFSDSRGREPIANSSTAARLYSTGRGGAGNIRSPSRDPSKPAIDAAEQEIIQTHIAASQIEPVSSGRGGIGNISSRSQSRGPVVQNLVHSTGRGGAGNIIAGEAGAAEALDDIERKQLAAENDSTAVHSTGRGGVANYAPGREPGVEKIPHGPGGTASTGRGGVGNIRVNN